MGSRPAVVAVAARCTASLRSPTTAPCRSRSTAQSQLGRHADRRKHGGASRRHRPHRRTANRSRQARGNASHGRRSRVLSSDAHAGFRGIYEPDAVVHHWVPAARLDARLFQEWLYQNGRDVCRLESSYPRPVARLLGVPRYLWRESAECGAISALGFVLGGDRRRVAPRRASRHVVRRIHARSLAGEQAGAQATGD